MHGRRVIRREGDGGCRPVTARVFAISKLKPLLALLDLILTVWAVSVRPEKIVVVVQAAAGVIVDSTPSTVIVSVSVTPPKIWAVQSVPVTVVSSWAC
jgi:hypothetical protein